MKKVNAILASNTKEEIENRLLKLQNKRIELEKEITNARSINLKNGLNRVLEETMLTIQYILPYAIAVGISIKALIDLGMNPFILDEKKCNLEVRKELDSLGNESTIEMYDHFKDDCNSISVIGKWQKDKDGSYYRTTKKYSVDNMSEETIKKMLSSNDIKLLDDVFGAPISEERESGTDLEPSDLEQGPYLEAVIYYEDTNDFVIKKQSIPSEIGDIICLATFLLFTCGSVLAFRDQTGFDSMEVDAIMTEIYSKYPSVDIEQLKNKLYNINEQEQAMTRKLEKGV